MKSGLIFFMVIFVLVVWACSNNKPKANKTDTTKVITHPNNGPDTIVIKKDTIAFTYHLIARESPKNKKNKDGGSVTINIKYPVFIGQPVLNRLIQDTLISLSPGGNSLTQVARIFLSTYKGQLDPERPQDFSLELSATELDQAPGLITIAIIASAATGGVHPNYATYYINWNVKKGEEFSLDDLLVKDYSDKLNAIAEKIFRKDQQIARDSSLEAYHFENGIFALNDNFLITPKGLNFSYNPYEITAYMQGAPSVFIPYPSIKKLLRPNTVISQYIK